MRACIAAGVAAACTKTTPLESTTSTIVVHAVLNAFQDDQIVAVQRTMNGIPAAVPVDSAKVTITGPDGVALTGVEVPDSALTSAYRVRLSSYNAALVPGGTYRLDIRLKTGEEITGSTTIPDANPTVPPATYNVFVPAYDTLRLHWSPVQDASSYEVRVASIDGTYALFADTSVVLPGNLRSFNGTPVFAAQAYHTIVVSAVDANYYAYYRTNSDEFTGAAVQGNLSGAQGVFGSLVIVTALEIYVATAAH
jgi:hypothetical protein